MPSRTETSASKNRTTNSKPSSEGNENERSGNRTGAINSQATTTISKNESSASKHGATLFLEGLRLKRLLLRMELVGKGMERVRARIKPVV